MFVLECRMLLLFLLCPDEDRCVSKRLLVLCWFYVFTPAELVSSTGCNNKCSSSLSFNRLLSRWQLSLNLLNSQTRNGFRGLLSPRCTFSNSVVLNQLEMSSASSFERRVRAAGGAKFLLHVRVSKQGKVPVPVWTQFEVSYVLFPESQR